MSCAKDWLRASMFSSLYPSGLPTRLAASALTETNPEAAYSVGTVTLDSTVAFWQALFKPLYSSNKLPRRCLCSSNSSASLNP